MKLPLNRSVVALVLTAAAISVPCTAWYIAGNDAAAREADRVERRVRFFAFKVAHGLAERLAGHLEALRESESRRPYYHYQSDFHDPTSTCSCASVEPSPLRGGPVDPIIRAHFQVGEDGTVTLPTLPPRYSAQRGWEWVREQKHIHHQVSDAVPALLALLAETDASPAAAAPDSATTTAGGTAMAATTDGPPPPPGRTPPRDRGMVVPRGQRVVPQSPDDIIAAPTFWWEDPNFTGGTMVGQPGRLFSRPQRTTYANQGSPEFDRYQLGFFEWTSIELDGEMALAAVRRVQTPEGRALQGFLISSEFVNESVRGASPYYDGAFVRVDSTMPPSKEHIFAPVALAGVDWRVVVDAGAALRDAEAKRRDLFKGFHRTFLWVSGASILAGLCIVGLIWQTDKLASQRHRFAASAAHELRTPLAGLRVYADMLAEGLGNPERTHDYSRQISSEAERLGRVVSNVLGYSRLERGSLTVRPQLGDLAEAVADCVRRFEAALEAAGAHVELVVLDTLPAVRFDRDAVFHIVQNLLDNAEKYTRSALDRTIHVALRPNGKAVELIVRDHGPGIAAGMRSRLFQPFTRIEHADMPAGLGLGLTLVRGLAEAHHGSVRYADAPDGGSIFTVTLPIGG